MAVYLIKLLCGTRKYRYTYLCQVNKIYIHISYTLKFEFKNLVIKTRYMYTIRAEAMVRVGVNVTINTYNFQKGNSLST